MNRIIETAITDSNGLPKIDLQSRLLGTQYDHMAQTLVFTRPDTEYAANDLVLYFKYNGQTARYNIGSANEFTVPNTLTQTTSLSMYIAFTDGIEERVGCNRITFALRGSVPTGVTPEPITDVVAELKREAHTGEATYENSMLTLYNLDGDAVTSVSVIGGDIGESQFASEAETQEMLDDVFGASKIQEGNNVI